MLDEYKEDFGTGIDDLEFDTPQNYQQDQNYAQPEARSDQYAMPPPQQVVYQEPLRNPYQVPAFQGAGAGVAADPVHYDQPQYLAKPESPSIGDILRAKEPRLGCLRTMILGGISIAIIALSFWGSFILGQKIFMPPVKERFLQTKKEQIPSFLNPDTRQAVPLTPELIVPKVPEKIFVKSTGLKPKKVAPKPAANKYTPARKSIYRVIAGTFSSKQNAKLALSQLKQDGFSAFIKSSGSKYQVQVGAFSRKNSAQRLLERALSYGYEASIIN